MGSSDRGRRGSGLGPLVRQWVLYTLCLAVMCALGVRMAGQARDMAVYRLRSVPAEDIWPADARWVLVQRENITVQAGERGTDAVLYRVSGENWTDLLALRMVGGRPPEPSARMAAVLSEELAEELWGSPEWGGEVTVQGVAMDAAGLYALPGGILRWFLPEEKSIHISAQPEAGEVLAVVCFAPGTASIGDYRLREQWGEAVVGYAPLYMACDWADFFTRLVLWAGIAVLFGSVFPLLGKLLREHVVQPMREARTRCYAGEFVLRYGWRALAAAGVGAAALTGLVLLARVSFPVLPLPPEALPGILLHGDELTASLLRLRQYMVAHPAPVLPVVSMLRGMQSVQHFLLLGGILCLAGIRSVSKTVHPANVKR